MSINDYKGREGVGCGERHRQTDRQTDRRDGMGGGAGRDREADRRYPSGVQAKCLNKKSNYPEQILSVSIKLLSTHITTVKQTHVMS